MTDWSVIIKAYLSHVTVNGLTPIRSNKEA